MNISKSDILDRASSYEIITHFLKPYSGGKLLRRNEHICSPLRSERTPSFCIFPDRNDIETWLWHDHGSGEGGSCFDLVMKLHNCDFPDALNTINSELNLGLGNATFVPNDRVRVSPPEDIKYVDQDRWFEIEKKNWSPDELDFWGKYGITKLTLDRFGVSPVSRFSSISGGGKPYTITNYNGHIFCYEIAERVFKIYRPGQKRFKFSWLGNKPSDYIFGINQLPEKGDIVILTGGEKDVMTLHSFGFSAICLNSETATPSNELIEALSNRFKNIVILYDNDKTGQNQSLKIEAATGWKRIILPEFSGKDISDWAREFPSTKSDIIENFLTNINHEEKTEKSIELPSSDKQSNQASNNQESSQSILPLSVGDRPELQLAGARDFHHYETLKDVLNLSENPDFSRSRDGRIEISFFDIKGRPYRIAGPGKTKVEAKRKSGNNGIINAVYLPPSLRNKTRQMITNTMIICQDEVTAYVLSELGIPSVGLNSPLGFQSRPNMKEPHSLIKQVMHFYKIEEIIYLVNPLFFSLPKVDKAVSENPYEFIDAAALAEDGVAVMASLSQTFKRIPVDAIFPDFESELVDYTDPYWLDNLILTCYEIGIPEIWKATMSKSIFDELHKPHQASGDRFFSTIPVSSGTNFTFKESFYIQSPQAFFEFHGIEKLGSIFQFGQNVYEYDQRDGSIDLYGQSLDLYTVRDAYGRYQGMGRGNSWNPISDFTMKYHLEIKQEDSFYLVELTPVRGKEQFALFHNSDIISGDSFKKKIADIPGAKFNFWGQKNHIEQLHAMNRIGVKEAQSLNNILGYSKSQNFYVYGNGVLTPDGDFIHVDEYGLIKFDGEEYYLPAYSKFNIDSNGFELERAFKYSEGEITFEEWSNLFIKVYGEPGHMILAYLLTALYRDLFRDEGYNVFPHFSVFAPPESGKTALSQSLAYFFGQLKQTNLRAGVTVASFDRKIELFHNALIVLNEFNLSNKRVQQMKLEEYLVGIYDYQGREKTVNGKSRQAMPNSAVMTIGQESFWHREALASRCIIQELPAGKKVRTQEERDNFIALKDLEAEGISHLNSIFFSQRPLIRKHLRAYIEDLNQTFKTLLPAYVSARLIEIWSFCLAPLLILIDNKVIRYPMRRAKILSYASECIEVQAKKMTHEGVLDLFFSFIEAEYGPGKLLSHQDVFLFKKDNHLRIRISTTHKAFASYLNRENMGVENTAKADLIHRLQGLGDTFIGISRGIQVGYKKTSMGMILTNPSTARPIAARPGSDIISLDYEKLREGGFTLPEISWVEFESEDSEDEKQENRYPEHV